MDGGNVFEDISITISYTLADLIKDIIDTSNEKKILYHGIKRHSSVERIKTEGLKPLTPDSVYCSFWSTGLALFNPREDSPFFCHSELTLSGPEISELNLAITYYDLLFEKGLTLPEYEEDSQIRIEEVVPYETIALINVKVKHPISKDYNVSRGYGQTAEQMLLKAIAAQIYGVFTPGETISYFKEIKGRHF